VLRPDTRADKANVENGTVSLRARVKGSVTVSFSRTHTRYTVIGFRHAGADHVIRYVPSPSYVLDTLSQDAGMSAIHKVSKPVTQ
jgi:hypothetical protein